MPALINIEAIQSIAKDANGKQLMTFQDKRGKPLMAARPDNDIVAATQVSISTLNYVIDLLHPYPYFCISSFRTNRAEAVVLIIGMQDIINTNNLFTSCEYFLLTL